MYASASRALPPGPNNRLRRPGVDRLGCGDLELPHPGREAGPRGGRAWSTLAATYARKFMQARGEWIQADGSACSGDLWVILVVSLCP